MKFWQWSFCWVCVAGNYWLYEHVGSKASSFYWWCWGQVAINALAACVAVVVRDARESS